MKKQIFILIIYPFIVIACTTAIPLATPTTIVTTPTLKVTNTPKLQLTPTFEPTPTITPSPTLDPVEITLNRMTLAEKVGQMFAVFFDGYTVSPTLNQYITEAHVGTILLFGPNVESQTQLHFLTRQAQTLAETHGAGIPLLVAIDQESWSVARLSEEKGFLSLPSQMALGANQTITPARRTAEIIATELQAVGINMNLAPVVDVNNNPHNPIIGLRSFGADPTLVSRLGVAQLEGYRTQGIIATAKHFPGHGDTTFDSHTTLSTVPHTLERLKQVELAPFRAMIAADVPVIMTAHVIFPAIDATPNRPATLSQPTLTGLLRDELGFTGVIATDSMGMDAIDTYIGQAEATVMAIEAGADLLMFGADRGHSPIEAYQVYQYILALVEGGEIAESRIDESVRRILQLKMAYQVWHPATSDIIQPDTVHPPSVPQPSDKDNLEMGEHDTPETDLSQQDIGQSSTISHPVEALQTELRHISQQAITLIEAETFAPNTPQQKKNQPLPLLTTTNTLFIYPDFVEPLPILVEQRFTLFKLLPITLNPALRETMLAVEVSQQYNQVVVFTTNAFKHPTQIRLVEQLAEQHHSLVVVALLLPYDLLDMRRSITWLATYGYSQVQLEALFDVLIGQAVPQGRLPVD